MLALRGSGTAPARNRTWSPADRASTRRIAVIGFAERGIRSSLIRLSPIVHSSLDHHGFAHTLIGIARGKGVSGYVSDGANRWPAVHTLDAARLYRLALESAPAGSRLHGVADEGVPFRDIAEVIGRRLSLPVESVDPQDAGEHFGFLGRLRRARQPDVERAAQAAPGLGADAPGPDRRPHPRPLLRRRVNEVRQWMSGARFSTCGCAKPLVENRQPKAATRPTPCPAP